MKKSLMVETYEKDEQAYGSAVERLVGLLPCPFCGGDDLFTGRTGLALWGLDLSIVGHAGRIFPELEAVFVRQLRHGIKGQVAPLSTK